MYKAQLGWQLVAIISAQTEPCTYYVIQGSVIIILHNSMM